MTTRERKENWHDHSRTGPFAGAFVTLEWDYTGWRWGYSRRPDAEIDTVIPMSGTGTTVVADLIAILTEPRPTPQDALNEVATDDGTLTAANHSTVNRFVGRASQTIADSLTHHHADHQ